jgi:putative endonuclease
LSAALPGAKLGRWPSSPTLSPASATALYTGSTDNIARRVWEHREKLVPGFTARYGVVRLVWYEAHDTRHAALIRERQIKEWNRAWKLRLIEGENPEWDDLYPTLHMA